MGAKGKDKRTLYLVIRKAFEELLGHIASMALQVSWTDSESRGRAFLLSGKTIGWIFGALQARCSA